MELVANILGILVLLPLVILLWGVVIEILDDEFLDSRIRHAIKGWFNRRADDERN